MDLVQLGGEIQRHRNARELSLRETAERALISPAYLRAIERAENPKTGRASRPSPDALIRIATALDTPPAALLALADYPIDLGDRPLPVVGSSLTNKSPLDLSRNIQDSVRRLHERTPFLQAIANEQLTTFAAQFALVVGGSFRCSADDEPRYSNQALEHCQDHFRAVSYQDLGWWDSHEGDEYLDIHAKLRQKDVEITRVFVVPRQDWSRLKATLVRHLELDIHTSIVAPDDVSDLFVRDFVIYDASLVRTATAVVDDDDSSKTAEFTDIAAQIAAALNDFERIRLRARRVDQAFIESLDVSPSESSGR